MQKIKWNDCWKVWKDDNGFKLVQAPSADAKVVDLPYDPVFLQPQNPDSLNMGKTGFLDGGTWNFYKELYVGAEEKGSDIRLLFEGAANNTYVFVNDSMVKSHPYAYTEFYADIASYLNYGEINRIMVVTTALNQSSRFYCGGGIYRDLYLVKGNQVVIEPGTLHFATQSYDGEVADLQLDVDLNNEGNAKQDTALELTITDAQGETIYTKTLKIHLKGNTVTHFSRKLSVAGVQGWDAEHPVLYKVSAVLKGQSGSILDTDETDLGFRTITVDVEHGLRINGKEVKLLGGCIHHDQGILGGATYDSYELRRVQKLKDAGFNAVRCAHNPASKALLRACDRLGMYIMDETYDMWGRMKNPGDYSLFFETNYKEVVETMVRVDYNHPSVIMYSIGNEIMDVATDRGFEIGGELTAMFHALDPYRPTTNAVNAFLAAGQRLVKIASDITGVPEEVIRNQDVNQFISTHREMEAQLANHPILNEMLEYLDGIVDISGYNYLVDRYESDVVNYPDRILLGTETHAKRIPDHWYSMQNHKQVIGDFIWTSHSYLGETGGKDHFPRLQNESCDLDMIGEQRPTNGYRQIILGQRTDPYIAVRNPKKSENPMRVGPWSLTDAEPGWYFAEGEGKEVDVEVYFAGDEAELILGGKSFGKKTPEIAGKASFRIPYSREPLTAVCYKDGAETGRTTLQAKPGVKLTVEREKVYETEDGLIYLLVHAQNDLGENVFQEIPELTVSVDDPEAVKLMAFGSYETPHGDGYQQTTIHVYSGAALAIVKKIKDTAEITFSAAGMECAKICL